MSRSGMHRYWIELEWEPYPWQREQDAIVIDGDWRPRRIGCTAWDLADAALMVEEFFDDLRRDSLMAKTDFPTTVHIEVDVDVSTLSIRPETPPSHRGLWHRC